MFLNETCDSENGIFFLKEFYSFNYSFKLFNLEISRVL